jgi:hypothetical protein
MPGDLANTNNSGLHVASTFSSFMVFCGGVFQSWRCCCVAVWAVLGCCIRLVTSLRMPVFSIQVVSGVCSGVCLVRCGH